MAQTKIVIGIDGGGTFTRALAADLSGRVLATCETGGASPQHNLPETAQENVQNAIRRVIEAAGCDVSQVAGLAAGLAGLDAPSDQEWADQFTAVPGLTCPRQHVNDAVVAHAGAFRGGPGIIAVSGTGSMVFGINEEGRHLRNYDFRHYAPSSAPRLAMSAMHQIVIGDVGPEDGELFRNVLHFWKVATVRELAELNLSSCGTKDYDIFHRFGEMGVLVTNAASAGSTIALRACETAAGELSIGIRLLGSMFREKDVLVTLTGGSARSAAMTSAVTALLDRAGDHRYRIVEPAVPPAAGAALMALQTLGIEITDVLVGRLRETQALI
jgi:glucosamine kinase